MSAGARPELPRVLLFDLDGTLLDSLPGIAHSARAAFAACGLPMRQIELRRLIGPPIRTILGQLAAGDVSDESLDRLERAFRTSYDGEGWAMTPHYPDAAKVLRELRSAGHQLFVVSNKPRHISTRILQAEGTLDLFDEVMTRDSRTPPYGGKLEMMQVLLPKWEIHPKACLMVGDTMEDAEAALAAGISFCLMTHGYGDVPVESGVPVAMRLDGFSGLIGAPGNASGEQRID